MTLNQAHAALCPFKVPLKDEQGEIIGLLGISCDITQSQNEIKMLKHIIAMMPGHVWWTDRDGVTMGCKRGHGSMVWF